MEPISRDFVLHPGYRRALSGEANRSLGMIPLDVEMFERFFFVTVDLKIV